MEPTVTAVPLASIPSASPAGPWGICLAGGLLIAPIYLLMRVFVKLVRQTYGFEPADPPKGPPLRICDECHNTVLEPDFTHCPYCGAPLPAPGEDDIIQGL